MLLRELVERFVMAYDGIYSPATVRWYEDRFKPLLKELGDEEVEHIDVNDLRTVYRKLAHQTTTYENHPHVGRQPTGKGYSVYSLHAFARAWKRLFKWAVDEEYLARNPAKRLNLPVLPKPNPKVLSRDDLLRLLLAAKETSHPERDEAILRFLADTSARVGGASNLCIGDVNIERRRAIVREKGRGGHGEPRTVYFTQPTARALSEWLRVRPQSDDQRVFLLTASGIYQVIKRIAKRLGIKGAYNPHAFRHGFAVGLLSNGANLSQVSRLMGHKSVFVTDWYYGHFPNEFLQRFHDEYNWMPADDEMEQTLQPLGTEDNTASHDDAPSPLPFSSDSIITIPQAVELAKEMGYSLASSTVYYAARRGNIKGSRKYGRDWGFRADAFSQWLHTRYRPKGKEKE